MGQNLLTVVLVIMVQACVLCRLSKSEARDLTDVLEQGFTFGSLPLPFLRPNLMDPVPAVPAAAGAAVAPAFSAAVAQAVTQEFPLVSVAPAFTYRYNPAVDIYERSTGVPGPLFGERALTLGKGQFNFNVGYAFIDFSDVNGTDLDNVKSPGLFVEFFPEESVPAGRLPTGETFFFVPVADTLLRTRTDLQAHVIVPTLRYGILDRWEVGLSIPIVNTFLRVRNEVVRVVEPAEPAGGAWTLDAQGNLEEFLAFIDPAGQVLRAPEIPLVKSQRSPKTLARAAGSATGVGDIVLRSKYHFWRSLVGGAALGLNLQLPSGEVRNFHGTGETHLSTFVYLSQVLGERFEPHLNIGVDFNADDVDRSSFLYVVGSTLRLGSRLGVTVNFLGRSEFGKFPVRVPPEGITVGFALDKEPNDCTAEQPCFPDVERGLIEFPLFPVKIKRNDIADFSFGLRYRLGESGSVFFGGVVPLNSDGFRPDFIPSGGVEYSF